MTSFVELAPEPRNDIKTYMRIGYTLSAAISDILDNSITAQSSKINICTSYESGSPSLSIVDDGFGMSKDELIANMRIACKDPDQKRNEGDLGRFGSGMKTASFSQARKLTVISKKQGQSLTAAAWDIDLIEETNSWKLQVLETPDFDRIPNLKIDSESKSGTQIIWENLSFISSGDHSVDYQEQVDERLEEIRNHIALYFHRFMTGSGKLAFMINNDPIEPVDPFFTSAKGYQEGQYEYFREKSGKVEIQGHILPYIHQFKEAEAKADANIQRLGGIQAIVQKQGVYVYREKRLIIEGDWLGLSRPSQLLGLARVQVDIPSTFDAEWQTDVRKQKLEIPSKVKAKIKKFLSEPKKKSERTHTPRIKKDEFNAYWNVTEDERTHEFSYVLDKENPELVELLLLLDKKSSQKLISYLTGISKNLPIHSIWGRYSKDALKINLDTEDWFEDILAELGKD